MKKTFTILIAAIAAILIMTQPIKVMGQAPAGTTMWAETWTGATTATGGNDNATPSANYGNGTTVYNNGTVTYTQSANTVYVYTNGSLAGGTAPELLLSSGKTWTISNIPTGGATELTLTYKSNNTKSSVTCSTAGATISGSSKSYTITPNGAATITLVFGCSGNTRIDDVSLTVKTAGSSDEATSVVINHSDVINNIYGDNTDGGSFSAKVFDSSDEEIDGAAVSWSSSNTDVATIHPSTGAVTLDAVGSTTITASYAGSSGYQSSFATYTLTVVNENPAITTIWSEDFSGYVADQVPSGGSYSYACTNGGGTTKIYNQANTGGVAPELLVGKSSGTFSATIPLLTSTYGYLGDLTLKYKTNAKGLNVNTTTDGITVDGEASTGAGQTYNTLGEHTVTFKGITTTTENITIVFTTTTSDNVRLDDIVLKGEQAALTKVATPVISPASGAVVSGTKVTITCDTDGATIKYSYDNMTWNDYSSALTITENKTVYAKGIKGGLTDSDVATAIYTIAMPCATPTFSVATGEVDPGTTVTISTTTDGATIYYTTNGSDPTTSSTVYSSAITINSAMTIKAIAVKAGNANSEVASVSYTIKDYATLPFNWTGGTTLSGGGKDQLTAITGVTADGLGTDYAQTNAPYRIKFDTQNDYIQVKTDSQPAKITIEVKMIGGGDTSKIKVQESADGSSFTDVEEFTISGKQNDILNFASSSFASTTRYVKIIKSAHGSNVGVGPIVIYKTAEIAPNTTWTPEDITPEDNNVYVISNDNTLTLNGDFSSIFNDPEILVIEDGGQLIVNKTGVQATVKKALPEAVGGAKTTGWTTIASPVRNISIGTPSQAGNVTHLKDVDYALYRLNEVSMEWENHKNTEDHADFTTLESGRGYLYSRTSLETLAYVGEVNGSAYEEYNLSITSANATRGFHLIGNPYSHDIYKGAAGSDYAIPNSAEAGYSNDYVLAKGFYRLKNNMTWIPELDGTKIEKGEGILVKATTEGTLRIYNSAAKPAVKANDDNIMFAVANSQYKDVTYALFDKGMGLNKIDHRDENAPMLYIPQNGENYAIAMMDDNTNAFNLNFEAKTTGNYTLSFKASGEFNYLHVIDRLTGNDIDMLLEGEYSFVGSPKDKSNRFIVHLGYLPNYDDNGEDIFAYQNGNDIIVSGEGELQIFDVMGRMVAKTTVSGVETINIPTQGVYIMRLNEKSQRIVVR